MTGIDPWFLDQIQQIVRPWSARIVPGASHDRDAAAGQALRASRTRGSASCSATAPRPQVRTRRKAAGIAPVYKRVDTCAAEFEAHTPYLYSTYERESEARAHRRAAR